MKDHNHVIENEVKKMLIEDNSLLINNVESLEIIFELIKKFGCQQKNIYYQLPLIFSNKNLLNNVFNLCKRFNIKH